MIDKIVLFHGEQHYVVGEGLVEKWEGDPKDDIVVLALNRVEIASPKGITRVVWVNANHITWLVTQRDYRDSEWYLGVTGYGNGQP